MNILVKSSHGFSQVSADSKLLSQRKIFVTGEIGEESACEFVKKIMLLNAEDQDAPIDVLYYTAGGEITAGMMMYDAIRASKAPVRMFCAKAYSMGAVLFSSGTHGRYMLPHGELMLHEPLIGSSVSGNSSSIKSISDSLQEMKHKMNRILADNTGRSEDEVEKACSYNHFFSPEESVEFGLADKVTDFGMMMNRYSNG